jgi:protein SCO1
MKRRDFIASLGSASLLPLAFTGNHVQGVPSAKAPRGPRADYFPNFTLRTHENKRVKFYDDLVCGKVVVFNFMYASCTGICPGMISNLVKVQKELGSRAGHDFFMYSISLDPEKDTPRALKASARAYGIKPGWQFLTGSKDDIEVLRRKLGFVNPDPEKDKDKEQHTGLVRIGNETYDKWLACPGMATVETITKSIMWMVDLNKG